MTAAGVPCNLGPWPWSKEGAPRCAWRWGNSQPVDRGQCHHQPGWWSPTCRACRVGRWWGGAGSRRGPHLPFEAAAQSGLQLRVDGRHLCQGRQAESSHPRLPRWPWRAAEARPAQSGRQGRPQPPTDTTRGQIGLTILGLGVSGRDVPSPAWRSPGIRGRGISGQSLGPARNGGQGRVGYGRVW